MSRQRRERARDRGSVLVLALVFMVIGSLMVVPLLSYSMSVLRANSVLSDKTQRLEAVKGGLRVALANPLDLYKTCGDTEEQLGQVQINGMTVANNCRFLYAATALAETEIRYGIITTQLDESAPGYLAGSRYTPSDPSSATAWLADTTLDSVTGKIMLPNLPAYGTSPRSPLGSEMPTDLILNGAPSCKVYFPGKYNDPLTIDGPTFFVNGVYYFTQPVRILGGADVVVGDGTFEGCTTSQEAVFYAEPAPSGSHNVDGLGATWVLGGAARVIFDNTVTRDGSPNSQPINFMFNQRYVAPEELATRPSADVSIVTVTGDPDRTPDIPGEGRYLEVYDPADPARPILHVPEQQVGAVADDPATTEVNEADTVRDTGEFATDNGYVPSLYTPQPRVPSAPTSVTVERQVNALTVRWAPPVDDGNSPVVGYVARAWTASGTVEAGSCTTNGALACVITGLNSSLDHQVTVEAVNDWMSGQDPVPTPERWSATTTWRPSTGSFTAPVAPNRPTVTMYRSDTVDTPRTSGIAHVEFTPMPQPANRTPISGYDIEYAQTATLDGVPIASGAQVWRSCNDTVPDIDTSRPDIDATVAALDPATLYCDFSGLDPTVQYDFRVTARYADTLTVRSATPDPRHARTASMSIDVLALTHALLDTTDPANPFYGKLAAYVTANWGTHADHTPTPPELPDAGLPIPVVQLNLTTAGVPAKINIASYIAAPQGRFDLQNPNAYDVRVGGGILAASMTIEDARRTCPAGSPSDCVPDAPEIVPIGLRPAVVQRKFLITSSVTTGRERSIAVVQINQNGAYAVNSWEVQ